MEVTIFKKIRILMKEKAKIKKKIVLLIIKVMNITVGIKIVTKKKK